MVTPIEWDFSFLIRKFPSVQDDSQPNKSHLCTIILNRPLSGLAIDAAKASDILILADGGSNRFLDRIAKDKKSLNLQSFPSYSHGKCFVTGDMDSMKPDTASFLKAAKVPILEVEDQDTTDLQKALNLLFNTIAISDDESNGNAKNLCRVVIFGGYGGRVDHVISNINTLYAESASRSPSSVQIFLIGEGNICCVLSKGQHRLNLESDMIGDGCGVLPVGNSVNSVTSDGLQWNLTEQEMKFCGVVSSSNRLVSRNVSISTSDPILWCSELLDDE